MAINPETQYPGKIAPGTPDYPYGAARNITVPGDGTGTPWEAALVNDILGFQQAILAAAEEVPTGTPEKATASQYLTALGRVLDGKLYATVAALQASKIPDDTLVVVAERGHGRFTIKASGYSAESGDITLASGKVAAMVLDGPISVKWFGAVGDGVADDTVAIQAALDRPGNLPKWATGGIAVFFPQGSYRVTAPLQINKFSTAICGPSTPRFSGAAEIFIDDTGATTLFLVNQPDFAAAQIKLVGPDRVDGKYVVQDGLTGGAADVDWRFFDVVFENAGRAGLIFGRGLQLIDCQYQVLNGGFVIDWPNPFTPPSGDPDQTVEGGFRAVFVEGGRMHAMTGHLIENTGANAANLSGLSIHGVICDTFAGVFKGSCVNATFNDNNFIQGNGAQMYVFEDLQNVSINGGSYAGSNGTIQPPAWDVGNFIALTTGKTVTGLLVNGVTIRDVGGHVISLNGDWDDIIISNNVFENVLWLNDDGPSAPEVYAVVTTFTAGTGLSFTGNTVRTGNYARNNAIVNRRSVTASQLTGWVIRGTIFNEAYINETDFGAFYDANRDTKTVLYVGNGSDPQIFTLPSPAKGAIVAARSGPSAGETFANVIGTGLAGPGLKVTGPTVEVSGIFNTAASEYSLMVLR